MAEVVTRREVPPPSYSDLFSADGVYENTSTATVGNFTAIPDVPLEAKLSHERENRPLPPSYPSHVRINTTAIVETVQSTRVASPSPNQAFPPTTPNVPREAETNTLFYDVSQQPEILLEIAAMQCTDPELQCLKKCAAGRSTALVLQAVTLPLDGSIYNIICDVSTGTPRPFVPTAMRRSVFEALHSSTHPSIRETRQLITTRFFWPGMNKDLGVWTRACLSCQRSQVQRQTSTPLSSSGQNDIQMVNPPLQNGAPPRVPRQASPVYVLQERRLLLFQNASRDIENRTEKTKVGCTCSKKYRFPTTEALSIASRAGWRGIMYTIFPLLSRYGREILVYIQLVIFTTLLVFSILNITTTTEWNVLDMVNIALSGTATIVAIINVVIVTCMQRCILARRLMCCRKDYGFVTGMFMYFDLCPVLLSELLVLPILICAMFKFILAFINADSHFSSVPIGISMFMSTGVVLFTLNCVIRILIAVFAFRKTHMARSKPRSGSRIEIHFFVHMLAQMILQVITTVIVGNVFYFENSFYTFLFQNVSESKNLSHNYIFASPSLIFMTVGTVIIPALGIVSFIILNYYSIRQYPIAFFLDVIGTTRGMRRAESIVRADYEATRVDCCTKFCHTMTHCGLVMTSFVLSSIFIGFLASVLTSNVCYYKYYVIKHPALTVAWCLYDISGAAVVLLLNAGVIMVTLLWIIAMILVIALLCIIGK